MFFMTNNHGILSRHLGRDQYSQFSYADPVRIACAVVHLVGQASKSSVRTDQSATRGNAEERTDTAVILFPISVKIAIDDKFQIGGQQLRVMGIEQRYDILGNYDHDEVTLGIVTS